MHPPDSIPHLVRFAAFALCGLPLHAPPSNVHLAACCAKSGGAAHRVPLPTSQTCPPRTHRRRPRSHLLVPAQQRHLLGQLVQRGARRAQLPPHIHLLHRTTAPGRAPGSEALMLPRTVAGNPRHDDCPPVRCAEAAVRGLKRAAGRRNRMRPRTRSGHSACSSSDTRASRPWIRDSRSVTEVPCRVGRDKMRTDVSNARSCARRTRP